MGSQEYERAPLTATVKDLDQSDHLCGARLLLHKHFLLSISAVLNGCDQI